MAAGEGRWPVLSRPSLVAVTDLIGLPTSIEQAAHCDPKLVESVREPPSSVRLGVLGVLGVLGLDDSALVAPTNAPPSRFKVSHHQISGSKIKAAMDAASGRAAHARQTPSLAMFCMPKSRQFSFSFLLSSLLAANQSSRWAQRRGARKAGPILCYVLADVGRFLVSIFQASAAKSEQASSPCYVLHAQARRFSFSSSIPILCGKIRAGE